VTPPEVAIVGGGISGLAAAYELHSLGIPFVLLERAPHCGGVVRTDSVDGYTIDAGPDALLTQKPAAIDLCRELGLADGLRPQLNRTTFVVRKGRLRELPEASVMGIPTRWKPFAMTRAFSWRGKLRMAAEVAIRRGNGADESIASFIGRRFGREAVDYLAEPLLAGIHGGDPAKLSMKAAFPRFLELEAAHGSVVAGLRHIRGKARPGAQPPAPFVALPGGMRQLTEALISRLPPQSIRPSADVDGVTAARGGFVLRLRSGDRLTAPFALFTTPPSVTGRLLDNIDPTLASLCGLIPSASVVTVALGYRREAVRHPLKGTGFVVPRREQMRLRAVSWVSSKWAGRAPEGKVLLRAYIGGVADPSAVDESDETLAHTAHRELATLLGITDRPEMIRVYRWRNATPQLEVGHHVLMARVDQRLSAIPSLGISASGFRGTGIADCVADARLQARRLASQLSVALTA